MKWFTYSILFASLWCVLCACPPSKQPVDELAELRNNRFDFQKWKRTYFKGIYFDLPRSFENGNVDFLFKKNDGFSRASYQLGVYLSVEVFEEDELSKLLYNYAPEISKLDALHAFYVTKRSNSLQFLETSIRTDLPKGAKLPGSIQSIFGRVEDYENDLKYTIATVEKNKKWYVFQWITSQDLSQYLYDDFKKIIISAQ
jgi:hypothetical protein